MDEVDGGIPIDEGLDEPTRVDVRVKQPAGSALPIADIEVEVQGQRAVGGAIFTSD